MENSRNKITVMTHLLSTCFCQKNMIEYGYGNSAFETVFYAGWTGCDIGNENFR